MTMLFSVIVPVFNKEKTIERALSSVISQNCSSFELIVIVDPCTDQSLQLIKEYNNFKLKIYERDKPGPGGYAARNLGINVSRGDYILFLDADDYFLPNYFESLEYIIHNSQPDIIVSNQIIKSKTGERLRYPSDKNRIISRLNALKMYKSYRFIHTNSICIHKSKVEFFDESFTNGADVLNWMKVLGNSATIFKSSKISSVYDTSESSVAFNASLRQSRHPILDLHCDNFSIWERLVIKKIQNMKIIDWYLRSNRIKDKMMILKNLNFYHIRPIDLIRIAKGLL